MNEYTELAKKCGAHDSVICPGYLLVVDDVLRAFAEEVRRKTLEDAHTKLQEAGLGHAAGFYTLERLKAMAQKGATK